MPGLAPSAADHLQQKPTARHPNNRSREYCTAQDLTIQSRSVPLGDSAAKAAARNSDGHEIIELGPHSVCRARLSTAPSAASNCLSDAAALLLK